MLILGIETSTPQASVAIGSEQGVVASALVARGASFNEFLLPAIGFCLKEARLTYDNLGGVAVSLGPGLFSGMRVGVATAKALAQALALPVVGMASLDLLAYDVRHSAKTICAVLDARRNEVFYAFYLASPGGIQRMTEYALAAPDHVGAAMAARKGETLMVGNGALLHSQTFRSMDPGVEIGTMSTAFPNAHALVELVLPRLILGKSDSLTELRPLYLRRSAQPIRWDRMGVAKPA
ncbi:MAG: tRNA (adenosine(37)-N6)-threonylcarbamoyltransferase complex dimerization subunit type 1 TsaB [Actinobacteria bacterium]|nr:tRNA (adenosine(37)-N6)-threonylcarbamoyltransferase complex dimerization subunit type 1 TsaB [Actinomycetota bacterium]